MTSGTIGVVVIGRNEGERLIRCLRSVPEWVAGVVYVDSGSSDGSMVAAERLGATALGLDLSTPFCAARARNEGFERLRADQPGIEFVQFIDGDCELDPDWLRTAGEHLRQRPEVVAVCGRRRERYPERSIYNRLCDIEWNTPVGEAAACGGDAMFRADAFQAVGGFDGRLIAGEEPELCSRLSARGWKIVRLPDAMTLHDAAMTRFGQWWRRGVRSGFGYGQVWSATARAGKALYRREAARAILWGGLLPSIALIGLLFNGWILAAAAGLFILQVARVALKLGAASLFWWKYSLLMAVSKMSEFQGLVKFGASRMRGRGSEFVQYK